MLDYSKRFELVRGGRREYTDSFHRMLTALDLGYRVYEGTVAQSVMGTYSYRENFRELTRLRETLQR
jgi:hypothetical protein